MTLPFPLSLLLEILFVWKTSLAEVEYSSLGPGWITNVLFV